MLVLNKTTVLSKGKFSNHFPPNSKSSNYSVEHSLCLIGVQQYVLTQQTPLHTKMHLYNITIQKPTAINQAITGSFSAPKATEIIVARGKSIELLRQDDTFRLQSILYTEAFGVIRCIMPFRLTGLSKLTNMFIHIF